MKKDKIITLVILSLIISFLNITNQTAYAESEDEDVNQAKKQKNRATEVEMLDSKLKIKRFVYDSGLDFTYPDAVRGIYVTGNSAGGERLDELLKLVNSTDLNSLILKEIGRAHV